MPKISQNNRNVKSKKDRTKKTVSILGRCVIQTVGTLSEYRFEAQAWWEHYVSAEFMDLEWYKIKLRMTRKNEISRLIRIWKEDLKSEDIQQLTLAIQITSIKKYNGRLTLTSVYPEKIEGKYIYLQVRPNRLKECWGWNG